MYASHTIRAAFLVASVLACLPGCAGWTSARQPVAASTPVPELDIQSGNPGDGVVDYGRLAAARPTDSFQSPSGGNPAQRPVASLPQGTVIRGQSPNLWDRYQPTPQPAYQPQPTYQPASPQGYSPSAAPAHQPAGQMPNGSIPGSDSRLRQPMLPSGSTPAPAFGQPVATPTYGAYGPQIGSGAGQPTTTIAPGYGGANYAPNDGAPQASPQVGQYPPIGVAPGGMIGNATFPPDVLPPSVVEGLEPLPEVPIDVILQETRTGRFMFGMGVNSDAGVTGQIVLDERNFDIFNPPTSWADMANGTGFRGGGQGFRMEAMPGTRVQRYVVSFTEPYLFGFLPYSMNVSGFLFDRIYRDWDEQRLGGRLAVGNRLTPDLSMSLGLRAEQIGVRHPRVAGVPELDAVLGENDLYSGTLTLTRDTRDIPFAPTQGSLIELSYEQAFGDYDFPRFGVDLRQYFLVRERPDGSGRHTLAFIFRGGASGSQTPMFENYFAGGFSTLRGFRFRGASPVSNGVQVGGRFQMLGTAEYMFPLTADDMVKGVLFTDFGTVERDIEINPENYRVAPGFGLRVSIPALGPAPLAFDFAFPVAHAATDEKQIFSFFFGFGR